MIHAIKLRHAWLLYAESPSKLAPDATFTRSRLTSHTRVVFIKPLQCCEEGCSLLGVCVSWPRKQIELLLPFSWQVLQFHKLIACGHSCASSLLLTTCPYWACHASSKLLSSSVAFSKPSFSPLLRKPRGRQHGKNDSSRTTQLYKFNLVCKRTEKFEAYNHGCFLGAVLSRIELCHHNLKFACPKGSQHPQHSFHIKQDPHSFHYPCTVLSLPLQIHLY